MDDIWSTTVRNKDEELKTFWESIVLRVSNAGPYNSRLFMRTEDRLFDRGWVRSAMATRKCGNIYFPKYFMAVRPFFTRNFFQELFGLEGSKNLLENFVRCTI